MSGAPGLSGDIYQTIIRLHFSTSKKLKYLEVLIIHGSEPGSKTPEWTSSPEYVIATLNYILLTPSSVQNSWINSCYFLISSLEKSIWVSKSEALLLFSKHFASGWLSIHSFMCHLLSVCAFLIETSWSWLETRRSCWASGASRCRCLLLSWKWINRPDSEIKLTHSPGAAHWQLI